MAEQRPTGADALDAPDPYDVCIVGAGFAGTILAKELVEHGARTLLLDAGHGIIRWVADPRLHGLAAYEFTGDTDYPTKRTRALAVGGNSNFWTGRAERFHPSDFEPHPYTPPGGGWPISYRDLDPYYGQAERSLRVRGGDFTPHAAPRANGLPLPPSTDIGPLREILAKADIALDYSATSTPEKAWRFFRVKDEILPGFRKDPNLTLVTGMTATRIETGSDGDVSGVVVRSMDGEKRTARARIYVVACGGIGTPRLLLLSRSERFPDGIGNTHDRVGRRFNEHASINMYGSIRHRRGTFLAGHKIGRSHQFYDRYREENLGALLLNAIQSWVFPNHLLKFRLSTIPRDAARLLARLAKPTLYLGTTIEMRILDDNRVTLSDTRKDRFGDPLAHLVFHWAEDDLKLLDRSRELCGSIFDRLGATDVWEAETNFSMHHQGTCPMGSDPKTSVADPDLRVHGCPNLYVCGSEAFVTGSAMPPTLTIVALAHRLADHLRDRLSG